VQQGQLLWKANENSYELYRLVLFLVTGSDPNYPKPLHFDILYRLSYLRSERALQYSAFASPGLNPSCNP